MKKSKLITLFLFFTLLTITFICIMIRIEQNIIIKNKDIIKGEAEEKFDVYVYDNSEIFYNTGNSYKILLVASNTDGIEKIELPNENIINCNKKTKVALDYEVQENTNYYFKITDINGNTKTENITIDEEYVRNNCLSLEMKSYENYKTRVLKVNNLSELNKKVYYKVGKTDKWIETTNGEILYNDYDVYNNLANTDNTVTLTVKATNENAEILISENYELKKDTVSPEVATLEFDTTVTTTAGRICATITHADNQSGINTSKCKYYLSTQETGYGVTNSIWDNASTFSANNQTLILNNLSIGTYYLHVLSVDNANNKKETISTALTVNIAPMYLFDNGIVPGVYWKFISSSVGNISKIENGAIYFWGRNSTDVGWKWRVDGLDLRNYATVNLEVTTGTCLQNNLDGNYYRNTGPI